MMESAPGLMARPGGASSFPVATMEILACWRIVNAIVARKRGQGNLTRAKRCAGLKQKRIVNVEIIACYIEHNHLILGRRIFLASRIARLISFDCDILLQDERSLRLAEAARR